jgi:hypothetical protein
MASHLKRLALAFDAMRTSNINICDKTFSGNSMKSQLASGKVGVMLNK